MFHKLAAITVLIVALTLVSCSSPTTPTPPTPFPTVGTLESTANPNPSVLTLAEVNSALGLYKDSLIVVSGRLRRQPLLTCDSEPHPSPATWALTDDNVVLLANQFDQQVRQLLPEDVTMTVEGRLRRWEGPVGCGKQAQSQELWYLEAARILSPSPLTQATLTPGALAMGGGDDVVEATQTGDSQPTAELPPTDSALNSVEPTSTIESAFPTAPVPVPSDTPEQAGLEDTPLPGTVVTPTVAVTGTVAPNGTETVTPGPGTPTITPDATSGTPTATLAAGAKQVVEKGDFFDVEDDFPAATLQTNEIHSWSLDLFDEDVYDIKAIGPVPADMALALYRDGQPVITRQNTSPAGAAESMRVTNLPEGTYEIRVDDDRNQPTEYILVLSTPGDFELQLMGFLASGAPRNNLTIPELVSHYWNFTAAAGNNITITVTPSGATDPNIYLYGPGGVYITEMDDGDAGEAETLEYTVENSGLHTIVVEELSGEEMIYSIVLTVQ